MSKQIELAKKLKALAERGVGGEKVNAERMLADLLEKNNISIEDIESPIRVDRVFKYKLVTEIIMYQIIRMVRGIEVTIYGVQGSKSESIVDCTNAEFLEINAMYSFYHREFIHDLKIFRRAFVQKNQLFPEGGKTVTLDEMSQEEKEESRKVLGMTDGMSKHDFRRQLNS